MKKFISMVMAAAMVVSLVPATAFAAGKVTGSVEIQEAAEWVEKDVPTDGIITAAKAPELQIEIGSVDYKGTNSAAPEVTLNLVLDNAVFTTASDVAVTASDLETDMKATLAGRISIVHDADDKVYTGETSGFTFTNGSALKANPAAGRDESITIKSMTFLEDNELEIVLRGALYKGDIILVDLASDMDEISAGDVAMVSIESDIVDKDDMVYASVLDYGITATTRKVGVIAEEEHDVLAKDIKIKSNVGDFVKYQVFELKLSKGFEFYNVYNKADNYAFSAIDDNVVRLSYQATTPSNSFTIDFDDIEIEAVDAKAGAECVMTIKALKNTNLAGNAVTLSGSFDAKTTVKVLDVVDYKVIMSVDADEDTPVMWNGVNAANYGLTADADEHWSAEVTIEEHSPALGA